MTTGKNSHGYHYILVNLVSNNHAAPLRGSVTISFFFLLHVIEKNVHTHSWVAVCSREKSALHVFHCSVNFLFVLYAVLVRSLHLFSPDIGLHTYIQYIAPIYIYIYLYKSKLV